ncbi:MAG: hypothetical protein ACREHD_23665 [Pirellulales bacterium]
MSNHSRFFIQSDTPVALIVNIEPECVQVPLTLGETLTVKDRFENDPVTLKVESNDGETTISVWPGDGDVRVEKDGVDVFELVEKGVLWIMPDRTRQQKELFDALRRAE